MEDSSQDRSSGATGEAQSSSSEKHVGAETFFPPCIRVSLIGLFVLAGFYTLYFISGFMVPVVAAILLNLVLSPIPRLLARFHVPVPLSAALIVIVLLAGLLGTFYSLSEPASKWMERFPEIIHQLDEKIKTIRKPIENVKKASDTVEEMTNVEGNDSSRNEVTVRAPSFLQKIFGSFRDFSLQLGFILVLLYFLLAVGDLFKRNLIRVTPRLKDKLRAERIVLQVERDISKYLLTITIINMMLGTAIGFSFYLIGLPNAFLWGLVAAVLNYIPYIGGLVGTMIITVVGLLTFDSLGEAMIAPLAYIALNMLEAQIITPSILGQRLTLNPVVVFLTVTFWAWLWGIPGALMAVPLLVIFKIFCDQIESMQPLGELIGRDKGKVSIIATVAEKSRVYSR